MNQSLVRTTALDKKDSLIVGPEKRDIIWNCHTILVVTEYLLVWGSLALVDASVCRGYKTNIDTTSGGCRTRSYRGMCRSGSYAGR